MTEAVQKIKSHKTEDTIIVVSVLLLIGAIFYLYKKNNKSSVSTTSTPVDLDPTLLPTPTDTTTTGSSVSSNDAILANKQIVYPTTVGTTNIPAPTDYYAIKNSEEEGIPDNMTGTVVPLTTSPYNDGGILLSDVPVETLSSGQKVQFVIYSPAYPQQLSKDNITEYLSVANTGGGYCWQYDSAKGAIYCSVVGSKSIYPMSFDTAQDMGMQQDITDLLFVDSGYLTLFDKPIIAKYSNGYYSLSPVDPTVDLTYIRLDNTIGVPYNNTDNISPDAPLTESILNANQKNPSTISVGHNKVNWYKVVFKSLNNWAIIAVPVSSLPGSGIGGMPYDIDYNTGFLVVKYENSYYLVDPNLLVKTW